MLKKIVQNLQRSLKFETIPRYFQSSIELATLRISMIQYISTYFSISTPLCGSYHMIVLVTFKVSYNAGDKTSRKVHGNNPMY